MAGMASIREMRNRVADASVLLGSGNPQRQAIEQHEREILDMNREQLYEFGHNPLGISIGNYSPYTMKVKQEKGQPFDRVTLRDTGDFYAAFHLQADNTGFYISSSDWKTDELLLKYGNVFGLTEENRLKVAWSFLFPFVLQQVKRVVYGN